jgi:uncharacterized membrane protein
MSATTRWLLILSLALNLVFATALGTWYVKHRSATPELRGQLAPGLPSPRHLMRHLEPDERVLLREALQRRAPGFRSAARETGQARREVHRALLAEPFVRADLEAAMARLRQHGGRLSESAQASLVDLAEAMDSEGRARLAKALRHGGPREREGDREERRDRREHGGEPRESPSDKD